MMLGGVVSGIVRKLELNSLIMLLPAVSLAEVVNVTLYSVL